MNIKPNELKQMVELLKEASNLLDNFWLQTPECELPLDFRGPIIDELYGCALMLEDSLKESN